MALKPVWNFKMVYDINQYNNNDKSGLEFY